MKNAKSQLNKAIQRTSNFMLAIDSSSSARIPEWYEQVAMSASHDGLNNTIYQRILNKLRAKLELEYGDSVSKHLLSV